jgi:hypothetical protein
MMMIIIITVLSHGAIAATATIVAIRVVLNFGKLQPRSAIISTIDIVILIVASVQVLGDFCLYQSTGEFFHITAIGIDVALSQGSQLAEQTVYDGIRFNVCFLADFARYMSFARLLRLRYVSSAVDTSFRAFGREALRRTLLLRRYHGKSYPGPFPAWKRRLVSSVSSADHTVQTQRSPYQR